MVVRLMLAAPLLLVALAGCLDTGSPLGAENVVADDDRRSWVIDGFGNEVDPSSYPGELPEMKMKYVSQRIGGEPTLGVTRHGSLVYAAIDFDAGFGVTSQPRTIYSRSWDQGDSWEDVTPRTLNTVPNHPISGDPYVHVDPDTGRIFVVDMGPNVACNTVSWSDNEGKTWSVPRHGACPLPVADHPTLFTGPKVHVAGAASVPFGPLSYPNAVYLCNNQVAQAKCAYSLDGGYTWSEAVLVYPGVKPDPDPAYVTDCFGEEGGKCLENVCSGFTSHGTTDRNDGTVYVPRALCRDPVISISRDGGATYDYAPVVEGEMYWTEPGVHDTMVAVDTAGTVYYFWLGGNGTRAYLAVSHDQGQTWDHPLDVTAPGLTGVRFPGIAAGLDGRITFLYMGTDNPRGLEVGRDLDDPTNQAIWENATWNGYVGFSLDADQESPTFAITTINDPAEPLKRGECEGRCPGNGREGGPYDFLDIEIDPITGQAFAAIVDVCTGFCDEPGSNANAPQRSFAAVGVQVGGSRLLDGTEYDRP